MRVKLAKDPEFEVEGQNLVTEVALAPWEAVLGKQVSVKTLDGQVNIKVPPGTPNGQRLRLRGQGLPIKGGVRGDLFAKISIQVPSQITERERALWEQLARESNFNPRD